MNLLVISHTPHYLQEGQIVGWGPTVREIDHLASLFGRVTHLAMLHEEDAPRSSLAYAARNVQLLPIRPTGGERWKDKLGIVQAYPGYWHAIRSALSTMKNEDVIHVRCPSNLSLLALLYLTISHRHPRRWFKYAGNWSPSEAEPWSYSFQRWLLEKGWHNGSVTVNGCWVDQKPYIYSFANPSFEKTELVTIHKNLAEKKLCPPYRFLFVGRVETPKGMGRIILVCKLLREKGIPFQFEVFGDGPECSLFEDQAKKLDLDTQIIFHGWQAKTVLHDYFQRAHFILLPTSASEGWPKVLSEGMAYGAVPLAGAVSSIPQVLKECGTGMALDPSDPEAFVNAILAYVREPERWKRESNAAARAASQFTYEAYLEHLQSIFAKRWAVES